MVIRLKPTYLDEPPVDWHDRIKNSEMQYHCGFPKKEEILALPENSLIIIDDMADICMKSDLIAQIYKGTFLDQNCYIYIFYFIDNYFQLFRVNEIYQLS